MGYSNPWFLELPVRVLCSTWTRTGQTCPLLHLLVEDHSLILKSSSMQNLNRSLARLLQETLSSAFVRSVFLDGTASALLRFFSPILKFQTLHIPTAEPVYIPSLVVTFWHLKAPSFSIPSNLKPSTILFSQWKSVCQKHLLLWLTT